MTDTSPDLLEALRSGAVCMVPVEATQWQWRIRLRGGAWDAWEQGRFGQEIPPFADVEERAVFTVSPASPDHTAAVVALIEGLSDRAESCDQWRKLALQFDRHRIEAMSLIKSVAAGTAGATECAAFAAAPPPLTSPAEAERDALREALAEAIEFADQDAQALTAAGVALVERWRALTQETNDG